MKKILFLFFPVIFFASLVHAQSGAAASPAVYSNGNNYVLHAKLTDRNTGRPAANILGYVTIPGSRFQLKSAVSDDNGRLTFLLKGMDRPKQLIFQTGSRKDSAYFFTLENPAVTKFSAPEVVDSFPVMDTTAFYGVPDKSYLLDDYTRFPTMEEVFREFVEEVKQRKSGNSFRLYVLNLPLRVYFDEPPLILLDGIPVYDIDRLMQLDPLRINKIDVVTHKYFYEGMEYMGIISLSSYQGDFAGYALPSNAMVSDYNGNYVK